MDDPGRMHFRHMDEGNDADFAALAPPARRRGRGSPAERARLLAVHLRTGYLCAYDPDPARPVRWRVSLRDP